MIKLKEYKNQKHGKLDMTNFIPSGVESGDSKSELLIIVPLIKHPELKDTYRAIDPDTGWLGWVDYVPSITNTTKPTTQQTQQQKDRTEYEDKLSILKKKKDLLDLGVITDHEANLEQLRKDIKALAVKLGEI